MLKTTLSFCLLLIALAANAQNLAVQQAVFVASQDHDFSDKVIGLKDGSFWFAGLYGDTLYTSADSLFATASRDAFLLHYGPGGQLLHSLSVGGTGIQRTMAVAKDQQDNLYAAIRFNSQAIVATDTFPSPNGFDCLLLKISPTGKLLWNKHISCTNHFEARSMALVDTGLFLLGDFLDTLKTEMGDLVSSGSRDLCLLKLDTAGKLLKQKKMGSTTWEIAHALQASSQGELYLAGRFQKDFEIDTFSVQAVVGEDLYYAKLDSAWNPLWLKSMGGAGSDRAEALHLSMDGQLYLAGIFEQILPIGNSSYTSAGEYDAFVARLDPADGNTLWSDHISSATNVFAKNLDSDLKGNIFLAGDFFGQLDLPNSGNRLTGTSFSPYIAVYDSAGNYQRGIVDGSTSFTRLTSMDVDRAGNLYLSGHYRDSVDFMGQKRYALNNLDAFAGKFGCAIESTTDSSITAPDSVLFYGQSLKSTGTYYHLLQSNCDSLMVLNLTVKPAPLGTWQTATHRAILSPNPYRNGQGLRLEGLEPGRYEVQLIDLSGKRSHLGSADAEACGPLLEQSIGQTDKGLYLIHLSSEKHNYSFKLVKL